ncbi:hypothetical protein [Mycolicibacterium wolinskyi]|uniref:hypothetical protein n=1 Tax=Mycolicibacterium wolinskyi TaxID=59750 RepID=UPI003BA866CE
MAESSKRDLVSPISAREYLELVRASRFRVINRVAATKPVESLYELIGIKGEVESDYTELASSNDRDEVDDIATIRVSSFIRPKVFGLRVGVRLEDEEYLVAVDGTVEYQWEHAVVYVPDPMTEFLRMQAAPRVIFGTWAVVEELGRSLSTQLPEPPQFGVDGVVKAVRHQIVEHSAASR